MLLFKKVKRNVFLQNSVDQHWGTCPSLTAQIYTGVNASTAGRTSFLPALWRRGWSVSIRVDLNFSMPRMHNFVFSIARTCWKEALSAFASHLRNSFILSIGLWSCYLKPVVWGSLQKQQASCNWNFYNRPKMKMMSFWCRKTIGEVRESWKRKVFLRVLIADYSGDDQVWKNEKPLPVSYWYLSYFIRSSLYSAEKRGWDNRLL